MAKYENSLAAAAKGDKNNWEMGDAIIRDIGPPGDEGVRNGRDEKLTDLAAALADQGYVYSIARLYTLRDTAYRFAHRQRCAAASFEVHTLCRIPEMLDLVIKSARLRDGQRLTLSRAKVIYETIKQREQVEREREYEREYNTAKNEGRRPTAPPPPRPPARIAPPRNTTAVTTTAIAVNADLHKIMALIDRAISAESEARKLLEANIEAFIPEAFDAMVDQSLVASNNWREFSQRAGRTQRNKRGHLALASDRG